MRGADHGRETGESGLGEASYRCLLLLRTPSLTHHTTAKKALPRAWECSVGARALEESEEKVGIGRGPAGRTFPC